MNKDSIIFLIDSHPDMFVPNDDGEVPFQMAVQCAIATLSDKIISSDSDLVGVCFYGTVRMLSRTRWKKHALVRN
jgi:ATP-dependent DNA helicase 2 subunit 1